MYFTLMTKSKNLYEQVSLCKHSLMRVIIALLEKSIHCKYNTYNNVGYFNSRSWFTSSFYVKCLWWLSSSFTELLVLLGKTGSILWGYFLLHYFQIQVASVQSLPDVSRIKLDDSYSCGSECLDDFCSIWVIHSRT